MNYKYANSEILKHLNKIIFESTFPVEGNTSGKHKSLSIGKSLEFIQHREYSPGDDIRTIDWKVYARREKYFIKQYQQETNLTCYFLLDCSASMHFKFKDEITKYEYANHLISYISYILLNQNDNVGIIKYDNKVKEYLEPHGGKEYYYKILEMLENEIVGQNTDFTNFISIAQKLIKKNSLLIFLSDLVFLNQNIVKLIKQLSMLNINILTLHLINPMEKSLDFGFEKILFEDLEDNNKKIFSDLIEIREVYLKEFENRIDNFKKEFSNSRVKYLIFYTDSVILDSVKKVIDL
ncbi:MAG: DUF58 domain-containing protein [Endomicrobiia bacterium]